MIQHVKHNFITKIMLKITQLILSSTFETSLLMTNPQQIKNLKIFNIINEVWNEINEV